MKGLPLAYSKDMQEDKEPLFDSLDTTKLCLSAMIGMIDTIEFIPEEMRKMCAKGFLTATDMADWFVKELNMTFRDSHNLAGRIVKFAEEKSISLEELSLSDMRKFNTKINSKIYDAVDLNKSIRNKISQGGTGICNVEKEILFAKEKWLK